MSKHTRPPNCLIAAAPELLEIAHLALGILEGVEKGSESLRHLLPSERLFALRELKARIERVIAKAEGEEK